jgi:hypothetical protein
VGCGTLKLGCVLVCLVICGLGYIEVGLCLSTSGKIYETGPGLLEGVCEMKLMEYPVILFMFVIYDY